MTLRDPSGPTFTVTEGLADPDRGTTVDANTPWIIGIATKTFVAVVVLQLAEEGRLDLDAPIEDYFPDLPNAARITTRRLLQHTGGLNGYLHADPVDRDPRPEWSAGELIAVAPGPVGEPGAGYHHTNTDYLVLGEIVEKVTSRPRYAEARGRILDPLGLRRTGYSGEPAGPSIGAGFVLDGGEFVEATDRWHPPLGGAAGGLYSTTADPAGLHAVALRRRSAQRFLGPSPRGGARVRG